PGRPLRGRYRRHGHEGGGGPDRHPRRHPGGPHPRRPRRPRAGRRTGRHAVPALPAPALRPAALAGPRHHPARAAVPRPGCGHRGGRAAQVPAAGRDHRGRRWFHRRRPGRPGRRRRPGGGAGPGQLRRRRAAPPAGSQHRGAGRHARAGLRTGGRAPRRPRTAGTECRMTTPANTAGTDPLRSGPDPAGPDPAVTVHAQAVRARVAASRLATLTRTRKDAALHAMADALEKQSPEVLAANAADLAAAREAGTSAALLDRLALDERRVAARADALRDMAALPDPVGEVVRGSTLANGLRLQQIRVPFGVVGMIYEARPNVTVDAAGICLKSGNAVLLRGSSSAARSNAALVEVLRGALADTGLPADAVQLVDASDRDSARQLMRARGLVDVLIPRGGASLIRSVVEESTVPVIETGVGNCHIYVDAAADLDMASRIVLNAKTQ